MASTAITAQGSSLSIDATDIENITSFTGFDGEAAEIDITNLASIAKENLTGLIDNGSFSFEIHPDVSSGATGQNALRAAAISGATAAFVLTLSDTGTVGFSGVVKNAHSMTGGVDAAVAGSVSVKISGPLTITPPA